MPTVFEELLEGTLADVHAWSLPNVKGQGPERWVSTRNLDRVDKFIRRKDKPGFGTFFCVSTIAPGQPRVKAHAREMPWLFADVDFKSVEEEPSIVSRTLHNMLECKPSRIHATGRGFHCLWRLRDKVLSDGMDRAEVLLRKLATHTAGDAQVAHRVALLRVPGTHNTKGDGNHTVTVVHEDGGSWGIEEIEEWLGSAGPPVLTRRNLPADANPFSRHAEANEIKAPIDVEVLLEEMGPGNIHDTQLRCTASMMASGVEVDDAVAFIMDHCQDLPASVTSGWDWGEEERNLRKMCHDALAKFGARDDRMDQLSQAPGRAVSSSAHDAGSGLHDRRQDRGQEELRQAAVVSLASARASREKAEAAEDGDEEEGQDPREKARGRVRDKIRKKLRNEHVIIGGQILQVLAERGQEIMYTDNQCWLYDDGVWKGLLADDEKALVSVMTEQACDAHGLVSNTKIVNEVRAWMQRQPRLHKKSVRWDAHGGIAVKDGILDFVNDRLLPHAPEHHVTRRIECTYSAEARCPTWLRTLREDYDLDEPTIAFLQEFLGVSLVAKKPRTLMRALVLVGPSNSGKSNILNVLAGLISDAHNATELRQLENSHGLMDFLRPNPWVLHEAFDQSRWEMSATTKALLSGDPVNVNVKNGPLISLRFTAPIMWGSNVQPQFKEASRAMENRLAIVQMHRTFDPLQVAGTALEAMRRGHRNVADWILHDERQGVLAWAVEGLRRAWARGHFEFTNQMMSSLHQMRMDSNMVSGFLEECCDYDPVAYVRCSDFYAAFATWHRDHRGGQVPSADSVGRAMAAVADPRILTGRRISQKRVYCGLRLNDDGLDCWVAFSSSQAGQTTGLLLSETEGGVNRELGMDALRSPEVRAMQEAHRAAGRSAAGAGRTRRDEEELG